MSKVEIPKEILQAIQDKLPSGSPKKIAEITEYNQQYVNLVLGGKVGINDKNKVIIEEAQKIIEEENLKNAQFVESLNKTVGRTNA